jgi:prevent-host-death family protein
MQVNVHEAKTQLSKLLELVENGETVTIARHGKPVAQLVASPKPEKKPFPFGIARHDPIVPPGDEWWQPMTEEELADWYGE